MPSQVAGGYQGHINYLNNFSVTTGTRIQFSQSWGETQKAKVGSRMETTDFVLFVSLWKNRKIRTVLEIPSPEAARVHIASCWPGSMVRLCFTSQLLN